MDILSEKLINLKFPNNTSRKNIFQKGDTYYPGFVGGYIRLLYSGRNTHGYNLQLKQLNPECQECFELAKKLGEDHLKDFNFTSIQFNKNYKIAKHIDKYNEGKSYIIGLGDYEGGELLIYFNGPDNPPTPIDIKNKFYTFDGNKYYHEVADFTGNRISMVYYSIEKPKDIYQHDFLNYINKFNYIIAILVKDDTTNLNERLENYKNNTDRIIIFCEKKTLVDKYKKEIDRSKYYLILFKHKKAHSLTQYVKTVIPDNKSILFDN